jgi:hypothetical protein
MMLSWILLGFSVLLIVVVAIHDLAQKKNAFAHRSPVDGRYRGFAKIGQLATMRFLERPRGRVLDARNTLSDPCTGEEQEEAALTGRRQGAIAKSQARRLLEGYRRAMPFDVSRRWS